MEDKPTLKEYLRFRYGRYVKTADGRYYVILRPRLYWVIAIILGLSVLIAMALMLIFNAPWNMSIAYDMVVIFHILSFLLPRLIYRYERFASIQQGSQEYDKASALPYSTKHMRTAYLIITIFVCIVFSMQGFTPAYLRSLTDTPEARFSISWVKGEDRTFDSEAGDSIIVLPAKSDKRVSITLEIYHTPYAPQLMIDGKIIDYDFEKHSRDSTILFSKFYFSQDIYANISAQEIHDGSVLTLTCGKWSYEWTFVSGSP